MQGQVIVIGSGIAGIAVAIRLAARGFRVRILESAAEPGGKLSQIRNKGYRFDAGPSLFTLPHLVDELFRLCGEDPAVHFLYHRLETICRYHYEDGTRINAWQDVEAFARELDSKTTDPGNALLAFLDRSRELYELTSPVFIFRSFHRLSTFTSRDFIRALLHVHRLFAFTSMHGVITRYFRDPRVIRLFDRYATYNGSDPFVAPGTLNVIPHLEHRLGAYFPSGGMYSIVESLVALASRMGVEMDFNSPAEEIIIRGNRAFGVRSRGIIHEAGLVVSDIDIVRAYGLMPGYSIPLRYRRQERSTSALIFYWGMKGELPQLELHNIFFSEDYRSEFRHLFRDKTLYHDPTVYVFISSIRVSADAPEGGQNWFVMINAPENVGQDWQRFRNEARKNILEKLSRMLGIRLEDRIACEEVLDPPGIESRTSSYHGSLYGISSNSRFSAFSRHPNFSRKVGGLYFIGGSVHPGGGIPLCLASAKIVDELITAKHS
jgi:phytoene desaturase